jgi:hypothetical protein
MNILYAVSDCSLEDAIRVLSNYNVGHWASVGLPDNKEALVIRTSDTETVIHSPVQFRVRDNKMMFRLKHQLYTWDDFWKKMISIYNIDPLKMIIVDEDDLY